MASRTLTLGAAALLLALGGALAACGVRSVEVATYADVADPPPDPYQEIVPEPPGVGWVWAPGYWYWTGSRYVWSRGYWARPPRAGHIYVRPGWVLVSGRYRFVPGHWAPAGYQVRYRYLHPYRPYRRGPAYQAVPRKDHDHRPPPVRPRRR